MSKRKSEVRDGMQIDWDFPIEMDDGVVLRADVFRPTDDGQYPVILSYGPYAKGLAFQEGFKSAWDRMTTAYPEILEGSSQKYQNWEVVDPEKWVPDGYVCVRVDSRGTGHSPGYLDLLSYREARDFYCCIEWSGIQQWSNGKVGLNGISYYPMIGWLVSALKPPHLSAFCAWEAECDYYRDFVRHGGILSDFFKNWYKRQILSVQYGVGNHGPKSKATGELVAGPPTLSEEELAANRADGVWEAAKREFMSDYYRERLPALENMDVPLLSAANWGGMGMHTRGNFEGYIASGSTEKWLEVHGDSHFAHFYSNYGEALQKQFFGYYLKGEKNGWDKHPKVQLNIRRPGENFEVRAENEWPLARTKWTKYYLDAQEMSLLAGEAKVPTDYSSKELKLSYETEGEGLFFNLPVMDDDFEITGPIAAKLWISSDSIDADLFLVLRLYDLDGNEVKFIGTNDPAVPVGMGWLRASHRKLDTERSLFYRPYHSHDEKWPLEPGKPVEVDIEIWPTCIVVPSGYRLSLNIRGCDYKGPDAALPNAPYPMTGVGPFTHTSEKDRPKEIFGGKNELHFGKEKRSYLLLPVIP